MILDVLCSAEFSLGCVALSRGYSWFGNDGERQDEAPPFISGVSESDLGEQD